MIAPVRPRQTSLMHPTVITDEGSVTRASSSLDSFLPVILLSVLP